MDGRLCRDFMDLVPERVTLDPLHHDVEHDPADVSGGSAEASDSPPDSVRGEYERSSASTSRRPSGEEFLRNPDTHGRGAAQAARDVAKAAHDVRRKNVTGRWSAFVLQRLRQINPAVETASIDPQDFAVRVKERNEPANTFTDISLGGSPKTATTSRCSCPCVTSAGRTLRHGFRRG
ncbi:hypothetical protein [Streptomyces turgidiscabies]|uniref:Uncharacterized protein n=1 Tax=Streptomyces turgidiscabies TaxID=85558 RepID=A0ABU0RT54_9ACTN|nr:hypothetical protein [Streptomyces turgidiscabies]MDQ0935185.1 hypothetical protein [Streptomyces turgidiscabies]